MSKTCSSTPNEVEFRNWRMVSHRPASTLPKTTHRTTRRQDGPDERQPIQPVQGLRRHRQDRLPPREATGQHHIHRNGHCKERRSHRKQPDTGPQYLGIDTEIPQVIKPEPIGVDAPEHRKRNHKPNEAGDDKAPFDDSARHRRSTKTPSGAPTGGKPPLPPLPPMSNLIAAVAPARAASRPSPSSTALRRGALGPPLHNMGNGNPLQRLDARPQLGNHPIRGYAGGQQSAGVTDVSREIRRLEESSTPSTSVRKISLSASSAHARCPATVSR